MPMPASSASRAEWNRTSRPSSSILPVNVVWTPAMIFIKVDLPAPFSPTRPCTWPSNSSKSTSRKAATPPKDLEIASMRRRDAPAAPGVAVAAISASLLIGYHQSLEIRAGNACARPAREIQEIKPASDQEVIFHPLHAGRVVLGDDRTVGDDVLRDAGTGLLAADRRDTRHDRTAMDAAGGVAH